MNKKTIFYGLLVVGGVLAYLAWKKHNSSTEDVSENTTTSSNTDNFVDDVSITSITSGVNGAVKAPVKSIKDSLNQLIQPAK